MWMASQHYTEVKLMKQNYLLITAFVFGVAAGAAATQLANLNITSERPVVGSQNNLWQEQIWNVSYLESNSDLVIKGTVTEIHNSQWSTADGERPEDLGRNTIHHNVEIDVEQTLMGEKVENLTLRVNGGTVGNSTMISQDSPSFAEGDEAIMFIEYENGHYELYGKAHGVFYISGDEAVRRKAPPEYRTVDLNKLSAEAVN